MFVINVEDVSRSDAIVEFAMINYAQDVERHYNSVQIGPLAVIHTKPGAVFA